MVEGRLLGVIVICAENFNIPPPHTHTFFTASNTSPVPASTETLWLIDWLPVRPPALSSGKSIRQKESGWRHCLLLQGVLRLGRASCPHQWFRTDRFQIHSRRWNLQSFTFSSCVAAESLWLMDMCWWGYTKYTHTHTHSSKSFVFAVTTFVPDIFLYFGFYFL